MLSIPTLDEDGMLNLFNEETKTESWILSSDIRHGVKGYRVGRYLLDKDDDCYNWDESYMFFSSVEDVVNAFFDSELKRLAVQRF